MSPRPPLLVKVPTLLSQMRDVLDPGFAPLALELSTVDPPLRPQGYVLKVPPMPGGNVGPPLPAIVNRKARRAARKG